MKNIYRNPEIEIIDINLAEVISTSGGIEQSAGDCTEVECVNVA